MRSDDEDEHTEIQNEIWVGKMVYAFMVIWGIFVVVFIVVFERNARDRESAKAIQWYNRLMDCTEYSKWVPQCSERLCCVW